MQRPKLSEVAAKVAEVALKVAEVAFHLLVTWFFFQFFFCCRKV